MKPSIGAFYLAAGVAWILSLPLSVSAQAGCPVVGIKETNTFYTASQRACFKNARTASRRGYTSASRASTIKGVSLALVGAEEVPPVTTSASGTCLAALLSDGTSLQVLCTHTIPSPTAGHVHEGKIGEAGAAICPFTSPASPISQTCTLTSDQVDKFLRGELYINVHTAAFPNGEIRGQLD